MKRTILFLLFVLMVQMLVGCRRDAQPHRDGETIALVVKTLNNPFFIDMQKGAQEAAEALQVNLIVQAPEREIDVEKQMQIIENLIQRKVDAICVVPSGSKEIVPGIVKANRADIPVLAIDTRVDAEALQQARGHVVSYIGSDNFAGGKIAGEFLQERLGGKGTVAILEGIPGHETGDERLRGFHAVIDRNPAIVVVASQTANWERDQGFNVFQNIIQSHPEVDALFACNDMMALGAIEAIAAAGKTGEIAVVGFDAVRDARDAIADGRMDGSVAQNPLQMGKLALEYAHRLISGEAIPEYVPVEIELIKRDNLASY